jgi:acid phosphatase (class A)
LNPTLAGGKLETSFSYPSGHSTGATVLALTLAELFPEKQEEIMTVSRNIGWRRVKIARHYPTDIYAGRVFALVILRQMKASPAFQTDFADSEQEIANVSSAHPEWQRPVPKPEAARAPELLPR